MQICPTRTGTIPGRLAFSINAIKLVTAGHVKIGGWITRPGPFVSAAQWPLICDFLPSHVPEAGGHRG